jgi:hypothetical protein
MDAPVIDAFRFGQIVVDSQEYTKDLLILPQGVVANWWRKQGHLLQTADLEAILQAGPDLLIVGQGSFARMRIAAEARQILEAAGIELIAQPTKEACQTYSRLRTTRRAAAALHLTC